VLDIGLPDGDGFNVVDWLRKHENLARLPLVVYSGRELSPAERRQLTLGPTHFLTKARVQPPAAGSAGLDHAAQFASDWKTIRAPARPQLRRAAPAPAASGRSASLVAQVRELVEQEYGDVWVEGEISNFRPAPSGHVYFTLKDADAQLPIVLFRRQAMLLRFRPEDGLHVLVRGRVSVYEQRGQMQLVAETMEPVGAGSLQLAFEQLKERLKAEGLFDAARKRPLPAFPRTVGIVTSPTGAVIRDFLNIVARRHSGLNVLVVPVSVQGDQAPAEIEAAIAQLNAPAPAIRPTVIVLARGGGSLEDLAAFNSERVARAIAASRLPVVSAIGHETDFTIADFAADLRAPTPSAAAELITEAQHKIAEHLANQSHRLDRAVRFQLLQSRQRLTRRPSDRAESRISTLLHRSAQRLDDLTSALNPPSPPSSACASATSPISPPPSSATIPARPLPRPANASQACRTRLDRFHRTPPPRLRRATSAPSTPASTRSRPSPSSTAATPWSSMPKAALSAPPPSSPPATSSPRASPTAPSPAASNPPRARIAPPRPLLGN
jgi:exodeoxyribonuclease VII large subunit